MQAPSDVTTLRDGLDRSDSPHARFLYGFDGSVAISVGSDGRLLVEATWKNNGEPRTASQTIDGYAAARNLAHDWADKLAAGREPQATY